MRTKNKELELINITKEDDELNETKQKSTTGTPDEYTPLLSEESAMVNKVAQKHRDALKEKKPTLSGEDMDSALTDVMQQESHVNFFKRGKRRENYEKRRGYEKEYAGVYDEMVATSEHEAGVIMDKFKSEKGSEKFASHERKCPYIALRMEQLRQQGEYIGDFDSQEFLKAMDTPIDDRLLTEEDKTEEGKAALLERRNKKVKSIEKVGDVINSWDEKSFDISSPEAILRNKEKFKRDLTKLQMCEEFDYAIRTEYPNLMEKGCECKYTRDELASLQAKTLVFMDVSNLYTTYLRIADNPYFAKVLDTELDGVDDMTFQDKYKTKRYLELDAQGKSQAEIEADTLYKYYTALNFIRNVNGSGALKIGDDITAAIEKQKAKLMGNA
ncbi:MAG: hypothetical protein K6B14_08005 [Lachnospiraceae bacterium]|nr:hypothetical protein [Lachnospiraceae bacterium]